MSFLQQSFILFLQQWNAARCQSGQLQANRHFRNKRLSRSSYARLKKLKQNWQRKREKNIKSIENRSINVSVKDVLESLMLLAIPQCNTAEWKSCQNTPIYLQAWVWYRLPQNIILNTCLHNIQCALQSWVHNKYISIFHTGKIPNFWSELYM